MPRTAVPLRVDDLSPFMNAVGEYMAARAAFVMKAHEVKGTVVGK